MAIARFTVEAGDHMVPGSNYWCYEATKEYIRFNNGVTDIYEDGDFIGKCISFKMAGKESEFQGEVHPPADPRMKILWEHGFISKRRVFYSDFAELGWEGYINKICSMHPGTPKIKQTIIARGNDLMVATAIGRVFAEDGTSKPVTVFYINRTATFEDVQKWRTAYEGSDE